METHAARRRAGTLEAHQRKPALRSVYSLPNCRRIARGAFEGAAYLREIYLPETVSFIGEDAFAGCTSLQGIYYGEGTPSAVRGIEANGSSNDDAEEVARYNLSGRPCSPNEKGVQIIVYSDFSTRTVISD